MPDEVYCHWCGKAHETHLCPSVKYAFGPQEETAETEGKRRAGKVRAAQMKKKKIDCSYPYCKAPHLEYSRYCREHHALKEKERYYRRVGECIVDGCGRRAEHGSRCPMHRREYQTWLYQQRQERAGKKVKPRLHLRKNNQGE